VEAHKICVLGDFAVGKTCLVSRFVYNRFSHKYLASVGVKADIKEVVLAGARPRRLVVWDIAGTGTPTELFLRYVRGASGYLLVADGTRGETLDRALELHEAVESHLAPLPFVGVINKADLTSQEIDEDRLARLEKGEQIWLRSSALDGANVDSAFELLFRKLGTEE
jgi:small GTP-binding protein